MPDDTIPEEVVPTETSSEASRLFEQPLVAEPQPEVVSPLTYIPASEPPLVSPPPVVAPSLETPVVTDPLAVAPFLGALVPDPQILPSAPPKVPSKKKKLLILGAISIGSLGLLSGATAAAYNLWYQNPDKVVFDAASSLLQSGTSTNKISVDVTSKEVTVKLSIDAKLAENPASEADIHAMITYNGKDYDVKASFLIDKDGNYYVKVNNVKAQLTQLAGPGVNFSAFDAVITKIDGNWIKITSDDTKSISADYSKTQTCVTNAFKSLDNKAVVKEITDVYKANRFIVVGEKIGVKKINGVDSLGYNITIDKEKAKAFYVALGTTSVGKSLTACDKGYDFKATDLHTSNDSAKITSDIQLWSSRFGHQLKELDVTTKSDDGTTSAIVWNPTFVKGITVTAPTTSVPISELVTDVEKVYSNSYSSKYSSTDSSAHSAQYTTNRSTGQKLLQALTQ